MRKQLLIASLLSAVIFARGQSITPDVVSAAGASFSSDVYELDWTLGELSSQTYVYDDGSVYLMLSEGFIQPSLKTPFIPKSKPFTGLNELNTQYILYPNPVKETLFIEYSDIPEGNLRFVILDITGTIVKEESRAHYGGYSKNTLNLNGLAPGVYIFNSYLGQNRIHSSKITKSN